MQVRKKDNPKPPRFLGTAAEQLAREWAKVGHEPGPSSPSMYTGNIDRDSFRPADDPHPHAFVVAQVEQVLATLAAPYAMEHLESPYTTIAYHVWVEGRPPKAYRYDATAMVEDIVTQLAMQIGTREHDTIVHAAVAEYRRQKAKQRKAERDARYAEKKRGAA
jgi:hypothetical protein